MLSEFFLVGGVLNSRFWICVLIVFAAHYVLSLGYSNMGLGIAMTWASFGVGAVMIFIMAFLGGKDIVNMVKESKAAEARLKAEQGQ